MARSSSHCSFVIPILNEAGSIAELLRALRGQFPAAELLVVDGGSDDGSAAIARELADQCLTTGPGRARQMNAGAAMARGDFLFFLHADSFPTVSAAELEACLRGRPEWGFCRLRLSGDEWVFALISRFINGRSRLTRVATGDQMLFASRAAFEAVGGFPSIPLMEDVAFSKALRRRAAPLVVHQPVITSPRRWREQGVCSTVARMWMLRLGYFLGVSPARLWRHYYGE